LYVEFTVGVVVQLSKALVLVVVVLLMAPLLSGANQNQQFSSILNLQAIIDELHLTPYYSLPVVHRVKIAIFDKGFDGYEKVLGSELPADTTFYAGKVPRDPGDATDHGKIMAVTIYDLMTDGGLYPQFAPQIYLYQVNGYTNFKDAIDDIIVKKIEMVSYSEVRDTGGNFDGKGVWNTLINKATSAGIIWANHAGNTGELTYNKEIETTSDGSVALPDEHNTLGLTCNQKQYKCHVRIILNWNDFTNNVDSGTNKDLDLALLDSKGGLVAQSALKQISDPAKAAPGSTLNPREVIDAQLNYGKYYVAVKNNSPKNFTASDRMRIAIDTDDDVSLNHFDPDESMFSPADNPSVITTGASNFKQSSFSKSMNKPEYKIDSILRFNGGIIAQGSSNSAALLIAGGALLKETLLPDLDRETLLEYTSHPFDSSNNRTETRILRGPARLLVRNPGKGMTLPNLGFTGLGSNGCFKFVQTGVDIQKYLEPVIDQGAVVTTTDGNNNSYKIMVEADPLTLAKDLHKQNYTDAVLVTPKGIIVVPRGEVSSQDPANVEVFQKPFDSFFCAEEQDIRATPTRDSAFWLPSLE
jgi:hypothetical protein